MQRKLAATGLDYDGGKIVLVEFLADNARQISFEAFSKLEFENLDGQFEPAVLDREACEVTICGNTYYQVVEEGCQEGKKYYLIDNDDLEIYERS